MPLDGGPVLSFLPWTLKGTPIEWEVLSCSFLVSLSLALAIFQQICCSGLFGLLMSLFNWPRKLSNGKALTMSSAPNTFASLAIWTRAWTLPLHHQLYTFLHKVLQQAISSINITLCLTWGQEGKCITACNLRKCLYIHLGSTSLRTTGPK